MRYGVEGGGKEEARERGGVRDGVRKKMGEAIRGGIW